eukprot:11831930-Ditylum_brightwellii.AAC.1
MEFDQINASLINKQVRKAFTLKHSVFQLDCLLFHKPLRKCLNISHESKVHWLNSTKIVVHIFKVVHKRTPSQRIIPEFFQQQTTIEVKPQDIAQDMVHANSDTEFIPNLI